MTYIDGAPGHTRRAIAELAQQLAALREMTVGQLRDKYRDAFGEPTRSRNKDYLRKKVAWRVQELAEGGLSDRARARIEELTKSCDAGAWRAACRNRRPSLDAEVQGSLDPRLPKPGTVLRREFRGTAHVVVVFDSGFEYRGERFASLSKIARKITGTNWNGYLFFGLQRRTRRGRERAAS